MRAQAVGNTQSWAGIFRPWHPWSSPGGLVSPAESRAARTSWRGDCRPPHASSRTSPHRRPRDRPGGTTGRQAQTPHLVADQHRCSHVTHTPGCSSGHRIVKRARSRLPGRRAGTIVRRRWRRAITDGDRGSRTSREGVVVVTGRSWLVGLGFRTPCGRLVRHFYVVDGMAGPEQTHEAVLELANDPSERAAHGNLRLDDGCVEMRRMSRDLLGAWRLSVPSPCTV